MNVLFVGKWDIAGAYIADRLLQEGNEVCWMTGEEKESLWNSSFKGNIYRGSWKREDYLRILKANSVDTVVFLTGELREHYEEVYEYESQMDGLTNLMGVLRNYPLKCFLYLSSLELDYKGGYTPLLADLAAGETLCKAYQSTCKMPVLILRIGCVYGDAKLDQMGYTGHVLEEMYQNSQIHSLYSPEDMLDVIYGGDLAMAVYKMLLLECRGTYKLMTGHPVTMEVYFGCLEKAAGIRPKIVWEKFRHTAPGAFFCEDTRVKEKTGWIPFYLLEERGIEKLRQTLEHVGKTGKAAEQKKPLQMVKRILGNTLFHQITETLLLFAATCLFLRFSKDASDLKYVDMRLMFVAVTASRHGVRMGSLAVFLACVSYVYSLMRAQIDVSYLVHSVDTWIPFTVYFITGALIGYLADKKRDDQEAMQEKYDLLSDKYDFLKMVHGETLEIKGKLQRQIISSRQSFGNAYEVAVELDSLKPELILIKVISILENIMECNKAAVYLVNYNYSRYARLKACSKSLRDHLKSSMDMEQFERMRECFRDKNIYVNTELLPDYPDYAAPFFYQGNILGFVAIYDIGPEKFTVYYQNLFRIITSLIEKNLVKAIQFEEAQKEKLYYDGTELLIPEAFEERLKIIDSGEEDIFQTYMQGKVYPQSPMDLKEVSERIGNVIRGNDFMGVDKDGNYAVILINMSRDYLGPVQERFRRNGLILEVV